MSEIVVLGAGAWGTALAIQAARAGNDVVLWARAGADSIAASRESPRLPGVLLPDVVRVTDDISRLSGTVIAAVPTQSLRAVLAAARNVRELVICAKGIEAGHTAPAVGDRRRSPARSRRRGADRPQLRA